MRRPPRPWRLIWILLTVGGIVVVAGGGIVLGMSGPWLEADDTVSAEDTALCDDGAVADEAAGLCYVVPEGWTGSSMGVGIGPTSTVSSEDAKATTHFGPVSNLPVVFEADLSVMVETVTDYACDLFSVSDCSPDIDVRDIDGHEAIVGTAGSGETGYVTVTVVTLDDGYSYALSVTDEPHRAETDAIHASLRVL